VDRGPSPVVEKLINLAGARPLMGGRDFLVAKFNYGTEQEARNASKRIEDAGFGASCRVRSFDMDPALSNLEKKEVSFDEWEELEEQRREKVIHKIGLRNAAGRTEDIP
jgi:DNA-binding PadR family transcriptional regulator